MASPPARLMELLSEASHNVANLPEAMMSCGLSLIAAALSLVIFKAPGGILLRLHGNTAVLLYYATLIAIVIYGFVEAFLGYWVVPRDLNGWRAIAKTMLWFSILPLVLVAALGGSVFLKY